MGHIVVRCGNCHARIKAPLQLHGQTRPCPGCGHRVVVERQRVEDAPPALVLDLAPVAAHPSGVGSED